MMRRSPPPPPPPPATALVVLSVSARDLRWSCVADAAVERDPFAADKVKNLVAIISSASGWASPARRPRAEVDGHGSVEKTWANVIL